MRKKQKELLSKMLLKSFGILICASLIGCTSVVIPDAEGCLLLGEDGASCTTSLSLQRRRLTKAEWDEKVKDGQIAMSIDAWAEYKIALLQGCKLLGDKCKEDYKKKVDDAAQAIGGLVEEGKQFRREKRRKDRR